MARKQTRRSVSLSISVYEAATEEAAKRSLTLAHLTELALIAYGVKAEVGVHVSPLVALRAQERRRRLTSGASVTRRVAQARRFEGPIRRDGVADMLGEL